MSKILCEFDCELFPPVNGFVGMSLLRGAALGHSGAELFCKRDFKKWCDLGPGKYHITMTLATAKAATATVYITPSMSCKHASVLTIRSHDGHPIGAIFLIATSVHSFDPYKLTPVIIETEEIG